MASSTATEGTGKDASQKEASQDAFGVKAKFIRSLPLDMSATKVKEEASKRGMKVSSNHIYAIRARMKDLKKDNGAPAPSSTVVESRLSGGDVDREKLAQRLEATIFQLGVFDAEKVLARMKKAHSVS